MNRALEALRLKREMIEWWGTQHGTAEALARIGDISDPAVWEVAINHPSALAVDADPARYAANRASTLRFCDTYWVDADMLTVVHGAYPGMKPQPLLDSDLPSSHGFVLFEKPIYLTRSDQIVGGGVPKPRKGSKAAAAAAAVEPTVYRMNIRGLIWRTGARSAPKLQPGVELFYLSDKWDSKDSLFRDPVIRASQRVPRLVDAAIGFWAYGEDAPKLFMGKGTGDDEFFAQWLPAFWHIMQTPITAKGREIPDRPLRKSLKRMNLVDQLVTFITLRRSSKPRDPDAEATTVDWSHRWLVKGHWRNQWYPSLKANRQVWVHGYVKGPEDKPLLVREKIYQFTR